MCIQSQQNSENNIINIGSQERRTTTDKVSKELNETHTFIDTENLIQAEVSDQKNVDTKFVYADHHGQKLIIENSYPRGGLKYTDPMGIEYVYAVFWTRITNNTSDTLELIFEFHEDSYQLSSSPYRIFKLLIPSDTLTLKKEPLTNYGLDLDKYLDSYLHIQNNLRRTIKPMDSSGFYVVALFNQGISGTLRSGLKITDGKLSYRVNDMTIDCGEINWRQLKLKK